MKNPIVSIRQQKGINVSELAMLAGISVVTVQRLERGGLHKVTPAVLDTLEKWGYSREQVVSEYNEWRIQRIKQLEAKMGG